MAYLRFSTDHGTAIIHNQVVYKRSNGQPSLGVIDTYWGVTDASYSSVNFQFAEIGGRNSWTDQQWAVANLEVHTASITCAGNASELKSMYTAPTDGTVRIGAVYPYNGSNSYDVYLYINNVSVGYQYIGPYLMGWTESGGGNSVPINVNAGDIVGIQCGTTPSVPFLSRFLPNVYPY